MKRIITLMTVMACFIGIASAQDIVYLNNGSIIKGELTEIILNEKVSIKTQDGSSFVFSASEVKSVGKDQDYISTQATETRYIAPTGYRGFVDITAFSLSAQKALSFKVSTTHGYQFNQYAFLGGGVGLDLSYSANNAFSIPVFAEYRGNAGKGAIQFTYGARLGMEYGTYYETIYDEVANTVTDVFTAGLGVYSGLRIGMRIAYSPHFAFNISSMTTLTYGAFSDFATGLSIGFEF